MHRDHGCLSRSAGGRVCLASGWAEALGLGRGLSRASSLVGEGTSQPNQPTVGAFGECAAVGEVSDVNYGSSSTTCDLRGGGREEGTARGRRREEERGWIRGIGK
jgi:hypothetical protein